MDYARNDSGFRVTLQHSDFEDVNFGELLKQTRNRGVDVFEALLSEQLSSASFRQIAIPWMNVPREPLDVKCNCETVDSQNVVPHTAARCEGECMRHSTRDPVRVSAVGDPCASSNLERTFDYLQ